MLPGGLTDIARTVLEHLAPDKTEKDRDDKTAAQSLHLSDVPDGGYLTGHFDAETTAILRAALARDLPAHMRPSTITVLPSLPLNPNGKVDRAALTATATAARDADRRRPSGPAPRSETELHVAAVWKDVLGIDSIAVDDNFFDLGGTSLRLLAVHQRLAKLDLGREIPESLYRAVAEALAWAYRMDTRG